MLTKVISQTWVCCIKPVFIASFALFCAQAVAATRDLVNASLLQDGGFEAGITDFEIYRYPRFQKSIAEYEPVSRTDEAPLAGRYSLLLPGTQEGGYRLDFPVMSGFGSGKYYFNGRFSGQAATRVSVEVFVKGRMVFSDAWKHFAGAHSFAFSFGGSDGKNALTPYRLVMRVNSTADVRLDEFKLFTRGNSARELTNVILEPDQVMGVYGIGEPGKMRVVLEKRGGEEYRYKLRDAIDANIVSEGEIRPVNELYIPLSTTRRGAYWVEVYARGNSKEVLLGRRSYVVINKASGTSGNRSPYGIAMEEHGMRSHIDARIRPEALYSLAEEIGAGNVRLFTAGMPDMLSRDGVHYDFSALDQSLQLCSEHALTPLLELGSNLPNRIPAWLRTSVPGRDSIDLRAGLRSAKLKNKLATTKGGVYFDLDAYESYLTALFRYLAGRVKYLEIWNEPGHKFKPEDFYKVASITRAIQRKLAPEARLLGFSSTKGAGIGMGSDAQRNPQFLQAMLELGGNKDIDILSYHSEHAFMFMGQFYDRRDEETGYVARMRRLLKQSGNDAVIPVWDTERGIAWKSPATNRVDHIYTLEPELDNTEFSDVLDVARRLPAIHAAAFASGVEKVFWFYMDSSTQTIAKTASRYGFFDAQLEPMPHLAVYDALTETLGAATFELLYERPDGVRGYIFKKESDTVILAFNWKETVSTLSIRDHGAEMDILDVMGNPVAGGMSRLPSSDAATIALDGWPRYLVVKDRKPGQIVLQ